jgi:hypothetical protein
MVSFGESRNPESADIAVVSATVSFERDAVVRRERFGPLDHAFSRNVMSTPIEEDWSC